MAISQVVCQAQTPTPNKLLSYGETEAINGENTLLPPSMLSWTCYTRGKYLHYLWDMEWKTGKGIQRSFSFLSILHLLHCIHNWGGGGGEQHNFMNMYVVRGRVENAHNLYALFPLVMNILLVTVIITIIKISKYSWNKTHQSWHTICVVWANFVKHQNPALENILSLCTG